MISVADPVGLPVSAPTPAVQHRFHFLDALRGIAAMIVVLRHAPILYASTLISSNSFLAVDFFFCLSGFVIAFAYEKRLFTSFTLPRFFVTRLIRLYPLAFLGTLLGLAEALYQFYAIGGHGTPIHLLGLAVFSFLVIPKFSKVHAGIPVFPLDLVMWTLSFELLVNLVYALMLRLHRAGNKVLGILTFSALLLLIWRAEAFHTLDLGSLTSGVSVGLLRVTFSFFAGVLISRIRIYQGSPQLSAQSSKVLAASLCIVFATALCNPKGWSSLTIQLGLIALLFPAIIYFGAMIVLPPRWTGLCAGLGIISYPLYLLHAPLLQLLSSKHGMALTATHTTLRPLVLLCCIPILIIFSALSDRFYDAPVRSLLLRSYQASQRSAPLPLSTQAPHPRPERSSR